MEKIALDGLLYTVPAVTYGAMLRCIAKGLDASYYVVAEGTPTGKPARNYMDVRNIEPAVARMALEAHRDRMAKKGE